MSFTLQVTPTTDSEASKTHIFDAQSIVIGRDVSADLQLEDKARIVSNRHAEVRQTGNTLSLVDLGSKNGTVLNGRRLRSGEAARLREADAFEVGDFEIRVTNIKAEDEVKAGSETLAAINQKEEEPQSVNEVPRSAEEESETDKAATDVEVQQEAVERMGHDAIDTAEKVTSPTSPLIIDEALGTDAVDDLPDAAETKSSDVIQEVQSDPSSVEAAPGVDRKPDVERKKSTLDRHLGPMTPSDDVLVDTLVAAVSRLAGIPWQFRHEFIGQTIAPPEEEEVFADGSAEALRKFLVDPRLDEEELAWRRSAVGAAAEAGALHQVAMLDGYKASIEEGTRHLLDALDPALAIKEAKKGSFWQRLPLLRSAAALKLLTQTHQDLAQEDKAAAERGRFRSAFIHAYLARMTRRL